MYDDTLWDWDSEDEVSEIESESSENSNQSVTFDSFTKGNDWSDAFLLPDSERKYFVTLDQIEDKSSHPVHGCGYKPGLADVWHRILDYLSVGDTYNLIFAFPNIINCDKLNLRGAMQDYEMCNKFVCTYCFVRCQYESELQCHVESKHRIIQETEDGKRRLVEGKRCRVIDYFSEFYLPHLMYRHRIYLCPLCGEYPGCANSLLTHMVYLHFEFYCISCESEIRGLCAYKNHCQLFHQEMLTHNNCQSCLEENVYQNSYELYRHCTAEHWRKQEVIQFLGWETEEIMIDVMETIRNLCVYGYSMIRVRMDKNVKLTQWLKENKNWKPRHVNKCAYGNLDTDCNCDLVIADEVIPATKCQYIEWLRLKEEMTTMSGDEEMETEE